MRKKKRMKRTIITINNQNLKITSKKPKKQNKHADPAVPSHFAPAIGNPPLLYHEAIKRFPDAVTLCCRPHAGDQENQTPVKCADCPVPDLLGPDRNSVRTSHRLHGNRHGRHHMCRRVCAERRPWPSCRRMQRLSGMRQQPSGS